ncbi:hypothetical protein ACFL3G_08890, partial [Planctomycetota bacterium]
IGLGSCCVARGKGNLVIAEASPAGYKPISQANILSGRCWSVPVLANGRIYARNAAGDMVCLDVKKKAEVNSGGVDWPQWHGPARDNKSTESGLLKRGPADGPELLWSAEGLGKGYSSVSIADGITVPPYLFARFGIEAEDNIFVFTFVCTFPAGIAHRINSAVTYRNR